MKPWETDDTFLARWLSQELTEAERTEFEASEEFEQYSQLAYATEELETPAYDEGNALAQLQSRIASTKPAGKVISLRTYLSIGLAASIAILFGLGAYLGWFTSHDHAYFASAPQEVTLPDGSLVKLNTGSSLKYSDENWDQERTLELSGEAFFEVRKGSPFVVHATLGSVTVLGTSFNVTEKDSALSVFCYTGKVRVEAFDNTEVLKKGIGYLFRKNLLPAKLRNSLTEPVWVSGLVSLNEVTLEKAVHYLEQYYKIKVEGNYTSARTYNVAFPVDDIETALQQVFGPFGKTYTWQAENKRLILD